MQTLVIYDIGDDRLRSRVERACRDHAMVRTQYSAFLGELDDTRRKRLIQCVLELVEERKAEETPDQKAQALFILVFPMCAADFAKATAITREGNGPADPVALPAVLIL